MESGILDGGVCGIDRQQCGFAEVPGSEGNVESQSEVEGGATRRENPEGVCVCVCGCESRSEWHVEANMAVDDEQSAGVQERARKILGHCNLYRSCVDGRWYASRVPICVWFTCGGECPLNTWGILGVSFLIESHFSRRRRLTFYFYFYFYLQVAAHGFAPAQAEHDSRRCVCVYIYILIPFLYSRSHTCIRVLYILVLFFFEVYLLVICLSNDVWSRWTSGRETHWVSWHGCFHCRGLKVGVTQKVISPAQSHVSQASISCQMRSRLC